MQKVWNLNHVGGSVDITDNKGTWSIDIKLPNMSVRALTEAGADEKALRSIKKYIVSLIKDWEELQKYHGK